eukprot:scaffold80854_cov54-Phaeocystis_antarctica.AAC.1
MRVTLEVSKLSGWLNADADCRESKGGHTVQGAGREAGGRRVTAVQAACRGEGSTAVSGARHGGAHPEHAVHAHDARGVEAQRLVERRRTLPRVERRPYCAGRGCGPADGGDGVQRAVEARLQIGNRAGVERTWNMPCMVVTLEVSQLETSASKIFKFLKSSLMSVMAETSQLAMGPYVAMVAVGEALVVKVPGGGGGLGDGGAGGGGAGGGGMGEGGVGG